MDTEFPLEPTLALNTEENTETNNVYRLAKNVRNIKELRFSLDATTPKKEILQKRSFPVSLDAEKNFDNFMVGPSNHLLQAASLSVSTYPGQAYPVFLVHGGSGLGKTHLLHAMGLKIFQLFPEKRIYLTSARQFMNEMIVAMKEQSIMTFRKKYEELDVLIMEDVHELKNKHGTQVEFFHIFNSLHSRKKQLIFSSDTAPNDFSGMDERIRTRLTWGLVLDIHSACYETRLSILKNKAAGYMLNIDHDVLAYLAHSLTKNVRELEGALIRLSAYASLFKEPKIDLKIAQEQLGLRNSPEFSLEKIAEKVSQYYLIPIDELKSKNRSKSISLVRHLAMYFSYKTGKKSVVDIARFYGGRDHTSVVHAVKKIEGLLQKDSLFCRQFKEIETTL